MAGGAGIRHPTRMPATHDLLPLRCFRFDLLDCFGRRADALFEVATALVAAEAVVSVPRLSLQAAHRRGWGSVDAALAEGRTDIETLRALAARHPAADGQPVSAVDVGIRLRREAEASPELGFYYHPSRHSAGQPIVAGWTYWCLAQLSFERDGWTAPLDARRVRPTENANAVALDQIRGPPARRRCSSSTPSTTRHSLRRAWPASPPRSWSACAPGAASTPTRRRPCPRREGAASPARGQVRPRAPEDPARAGG